MREANVVCSLYFQLNKHKYLVAVGGNGPVARVTGHWHEPSNSTQLQRHHPPTCWTASDKVTLIYNDSSCPTGILQSNELPKPTRQLGASWFMGSVPGIRSGKFAGELGWMCPPLLPQQPATTICWHQFELPSYRCSRLYLYCGDVSPNLVPQHRKELQYPQPRGGWTNLPKSIQIHRQICIK